MTRISTPGMNATNPRPRTALAILAASLVIVMIGFGIAIPLMPFYVTHFGASGAALGFVMAIYSLMQFVFAPFWGRASDRMGRRPILLIGILGYAVTFLLQGFAQNLFQFTLIRALSGMVSSAALPTAMAYIADITPPEKRAQGVGILGAAMGVGMIIGPTLGGLLTHVQVNLPPGIASLMQVTTDASGNTINLSIPFFAAALLALTASAFIFVLLPESLPVEKRGLHAEPTGSRARQLVAGLRGPMGFLFLLSFLMTFALSNMEAVLALYGAQKFGMGPADVGLLMGALGITAVVMQGGLMGPLTKRFGESGVIKGGLLVSTAGFVLLALAATRGALIAGALVMNGGNVLLQPSVTSLVSKRAKTGQGAAMGLNNSFQSLGRGIGPLWAGFAYDIHNTLSFWTGAAVQLVALLYGMRMLSREAADGAPATTTPAEAPTTNRL
ncbi:MAG: MFS transporter [Anaerolineae bacterium]|nr:MFS transporter [Anaerolineae bacterium]